MTRSYEAAVAVVQNDVKHVRELVEWNHIDAQRGISELTLHLNKIDKRLDELHDLFNQAKGARWAIAAAAAVASVGVSVIAWATKISIWPLPK